MRRLRDMFSTSTFEGDCFVHGAGQHLERRGLLEAVQGRRDVLTPTGRCYLRLRDFDHLLEVRPRYEFREERMIPFGRVIRPDDWLYENERYVVNSRFSCGRTHAKMVIGGIPQHLLTVAAH
jgi:hypothetical protein